MKRRGIGQVRGEMCAQAKLAAADVALARCIAAERAQPKGWISDFAARRRVICAALTMAIGGQTWRSITDPAPVRAFARVRPRSGRRVLSTTHHNRSKSA